MKVTYPVERKVSIWVGSFQTENDFDQCIDNSVCPALSLTTDIASICEVGFEQKTVTIQELLNGFSGSNTFIEAAVSVASSHGIMTANSALVCYYLECSNAPLDWGGLKFLGSFQGQDAV